MLFGQLMDLAESTDGFYYSDMAGPDHCIYRIFLYRLGSYSDFLKPSALESRGIMFRREMGQWKLVCRPFTKFFNWKENPFTAELDFSKVETMMVKEDGSLISTFIDSNGELRLKSKGSVKSQQVVDSSAWLERNPTFKQALLDVTAMGITVNCEWTSPMNIIVEPQSTERLTVLGARVMETGDYVPYSTLQEQFGSGRVVQLINIAPEEVNNLPVGEGVVAFFGNAAPVGSNFVKIKTERYNTLHKLKDTVNHPGALFDAVINERVDDVRALYADDAAVQERISHMERLVQADFNKFCKVIRDTHERFKQFDRKTYAITVKNSLADELSPMLSARAHGICMMKYLGHDYDYNESFSKAARSEIISQYQQLFTSMSVSE